MPDKKILIVEDNPDHLELTVLTLQEQGVAADIVVARDGAEALSYLWGQGPHVGRDTQPALVLLADGSLQGWLTLAGYERISLSALHTAMGLDGPVPLPLSVLVVEGDASTLELYRCQFEQWDLPLDCTWMPSAVSALMDISSMRPQLLITDLSMPGLDGIELLHGLQRNPHLTDLRIMVISGWAPEFIAQRRELPASIELLQKPVDFDWLRRYLSAMLALRAPVALAFEPPAGSSELKPD